MRGYGLRRLREGASSEPGRIVNFTATPAPTPEGRGRNLSGDLLVFDAEDAGEARVPGRQREEPGANGSTWSRPTAAYGCHALGNKATRTIPAHVLRHEAGGRLGAPHPVRAGHEQHGDLDRPRRHAARAQALRRLDRPHRGRRTAGRQAAAPAGPRAQRRHHAVGFLRSQALPARHHRDRQAQADAQRQRPDLRRDREQRPTSFRSSIRSITRRVDLQDAGARSEDAVVQERSDVAVALLGRRGDLGQPDQHAQPDVRREGPGLVHLARRAAAQSGLLQEGLGPSVGQGVPARHLDPAPVRCSIPRPARSR